MAKENFSKSPALAIAQQAPTRLAQKPGDTLTTNQGLLINNNRNSLRARAGGPTLLEDHIVREKIMHFDHARILEPVVRARGAVAHGVFEVYESMHHVIKAGFLQDPAVATLRVFQVFYRCGLKRVGRYCTRRVRLCGALLHGGGQLRFSRQQPASVIYTGCD